MIVYLMCLLSPPPISLPYFSHSRSFNLLICVGSTSQVNVCGTGPHVAVFTNGCINSVSCCSIWIMKAAAAGPLRVRNKRPCLPFSLFLWLSLSVFVLSTTSLTWFSHPETSRSQSRPWGLSMLQWLAPIPWSPQSQVMLMLLHGTRRFVFELMW